MKLKFFPRIVFMPSESQHLGFNCFHSLYTPIGGTGTQHIATPGMVGSKQCALDTGKDRITIGIAHQTNILKFMALYSSILLHWINSKFLNENVRNASFITGLLRKVY